MAFFVWELWKARKKGRSSVVLLLFLPDVVTLPTPVRAINLVVSGAALFFGAHRRNRAARALTARHPGDKQD